MDLSNKDLEKSIKKELQMNFIDNNCRKKTFQFFFSVSKNMLNTIAHQKTNFPKTTACKLMLVARFSSLKEHLERIND